MVVLSRAVYSIMKAALLEIISTGFALTHEHLDERFSELDFNMVQSLYSQLLVREAKKRRCPDLRTALAPSSSSSALKPTVTLRDLAVSSGVTPYKVARNYLSEVALVDFADFLNNPSVISDENIRFGVVSTHTLLFLNVKLISNDIDLIF
jgi:hypothetical protein